MKFLKLFFKTIFVVALILAVSKSWQLITDGFRIDKINSSLTKKDASNLSIEPEISKIFNQKFKYLSKGCQTYVFKSLDDRYVLKFIRYHRYKIPLWLRVCTFLDDYRNKRLYYKDKLLKDSLKSYEIASNFLKDETAIIYVHLNKTNNLNKKIELQDRLGKKYLVDLDTKGFVIQKKVKTFEDVLMQHKNDEIELKKLANSFLYTTEAIYKKGFINDDYNCVKNSGFINGKVIHSDVGSFLPRDNLMAKENFEKEFFRFVRYFKKWSDKNAPFLSSHLDEKIKNMSQTL
ncbi:MAG: hypothetical protein KR126chlam4_00912 [Candidatus Anoxychlamydiales bacterium]|uniref:Protein kinase domain-containing protein n=1 Tax=marine sediment metagenome TaxID=412755 RepID=A0A0F9H597_9ZZZZ|nr:hypothetical protein [Candidatus Anoxychlamydiales bacterium]NGX41077.1 hypothetical protein [Candidatus Anoxychlamydiales bacterium]